MLKKRTFPVRDEELMMAERLYCRKEQEADAEWEHHCKIFSEYGFKTMHDPVGHDPYVLSSVLCSMREERWNPAETDDLLDLLISVQYQTKTEMDTAQGTRVIHFSNIDLSHIPYYMFSREQKMRYASYIGCLGNRPELFPDSEKRNRYLSESDFQFGRTPLRAPEKEPFRSILREAEKYLGYPYVWGGDTPETSFDCSGFVSYVLNNCGAGYQLGRLTSQQLYERCDTLSASETVPGDLVFFRNTYPSPGITHVGFFIDRGMMLHAGDPIHYTDFTTGFFADKLVGFGRIG